jgi:4-hydroxybenzoate polyprenyltransferase
MLLAYCVGTHFLFWLLLYCVLACTYSWRLKQVVLIDCLVLAMLYTLRIVAGASAAGISLSFWLLAFSVFFFLSLAFVKRYSELEGLLSHGEEQILGRGYNTQDIPLIQIFGITSGYTAVLILALYLNSETVLKLYRMPEMVWAAVPLCLFWVSWIWMQAHRGQMQDDPFMFAIQDRTSLLVGFLFVAALMMGTVGWPW